MIDRQGDEREVWEEVCHRKKLTQLWGIGCPQTQMKARRAASVFLAQVQ